MSASTVSQAGAIRRRILHPATLIALGIAVLLLIVLARGVDVSFTDMARAIGDANPLLIAAAFIAYYVNFPIRGIVGGSSRNAPAMAGDPIPSVQTRLRRSSPRRFVNAVAWLRMGDPVPRLPVSPAAREPVLSRNLGTVLQNGSGPVTFAASSPHRRAPWGTQAA